LSQTRAVIHATEETAPPPSAEAKLRISARAQLELNAGVLPGIDNAVVVSFGLSLEPFSFYAGLGYHFPERALAAGLSDTGGDFDLLAAHLRACLSTSLQKGLDAGGCMRAEAGLLRGRGFGVRDPLREERPWAAIGAGPELSIAIGARAAVVFGLEGFVALRREQFVIVGAGPLHTPPALGGRAHAGVVLFW
jgi:hypothetical protein